MPNFWYAQCGYQHYAAIDNSLRLNPLANFFTLDNLWIGIIKVLPLVVVSYGVGLIIEFIFAVIKGHEVEEGYLVTGMLSSADRSRRHTTMDASCCSSVWSCYRQRSFWRNWNEYPKSSPNDKSLSILRLSHMDEW